MGAHKGCASLLDESELDLVEDLLLVTVSIFEHQVSFGDQLIPILGVLVDDIDEPLEAVHDVRELLVERQHQEAGEPCLRLREVRREAVAQRRDREPELPLRIALRNAIGV